MTTSHIRIRRHVTDQPHTVTVRHQLVTLITRSRTMHLLPEALARAQMDERLREAERDRLAARIRSARRARRRAELAAMRARRALAIARIN